MPLESCMILLDCSQFMRNGDYIPTRFEAQQDAANLLVGAKTQSHPESTVGVSAGTELLVSPTEDVGKILSALHGLNLQSSETSDVTAAVQVASLALKHRRNKNGSQRIVLFVGTPLTNVESRVLQKAGRQLKKNNVAIDVIALGELETNEQKLRELVDAANGSRGDSDTEERSCHLVTIPAGVLPSEVLATSPILAASGGAFAAAAAAGGFDTAGAGGAGFSDFGGVDPNLDPELAMALRVSMEEERARQERLAAAQVQSESNNPDTEMTDAAGATADDALSEEEEMLKKALTMSMEENDPKITDEDDSKLPASDNMEMDEDDDAAMQMALALSMQQDSSPNEEDQKQQFQDPNFIRELLGAEGVDASDPDVHEALQKSKESSDKEDGEN